MRIDNVNDFTLVIDNKIIETINPKLHYGKKSQHHYGKIRSRHLLHMQLTTHGEITIPNNPRIPSVTIMRLSNIIIILGISSIITIPGIILAIIGEISITGDTIGVISDIIRVMVDILTLPLIPMVVTVVPMAGPRVIPNISYITTIPHHRHTISQIIGEEEIAEIIKTIIMINTMIDVIDPIKLP